MSNYQYNPEEQFSIQEEIKKYTIHWKWFIISSIFCLLLAFVYLKIKPNIYNTTATILIKDTSEGRGLSELAAFQDLTSLGGGNNDIDDEVDIIKSKTLISKIVKKLSLNITQYATVGLKTVDIYDVSPIKVAFQKRKLKAFESVEQLGILEFNLIDSNNFLIINKDEGEELKGKFDVPIHLIQGNLVISKSNLFEINSKQEEPLREILISISDVEDSALAFQEEILAIAKNKRSSLMDISFKSSNKQKARDILNSLIDQYNFEAINDKNLVSKNTSKFIEDRLKIIARELDTVEVAKKKFKEANKISDLKAESELFLEQVGESQRQMLAVETQLDLTNSMIEYLSINNDPAQLLPSNIGIDNSSLNNSIVEFNRLVLERNRLLENSTELNPLVKDLTSNIKSQRGNLLEALKNQKANFLISKKEFVKNRAKINSKIKTIPKIEKDFRAIERQRSIKENLYLFLLKKREETSISMAVTEPVAKIIDSAYSSKYPIAPRKKIILLATLMLGLLIPFGTIYVRDLLDDKVHEKSDINKVFKNVPVLVEVARVKRGTSDVLSLNDRSVLGESFRILRTNLNYVAKKKRRVGKAIRVFITSTIKGEGKTFVSFNTVLALADSKKKVLVIGADIRNPQLHRYLKESKNYTGLSEYLFDDNLEYTDVLNTANFNGHDIDYITSGRIPPNPSELLINGRLEHLLDSVDEHYDYVIVDTAPTMLVTDTLTICGTADVTMFVVRASHTDKRLLEYSKALNDEGKIKNMAIVLNDVKEDKIGYGYGYGYGSEKKSFMDKLLNR